MPGRKSAFLLVLCHLGVIPSFAEARTATRIEFSEVDLKTRLLLFSSCNDPFLPKTVPSCSFILVVLYIWWAAAL